MFRSTVFILALVLGRLTAIPASAQTANTNAASTTQAADTNASNAAKTTTLTVTISGLRNDKGQVLIYLWNGPDGFPKKDKGCKFVAIDTTKAVNKTVTTTFEVTPGIYAVSMLHDENKNGKMDTNFFGIPREGYGMSNNVGPHNMHLPTFKQASFEVTASGQKISISARY